MKNRKWLKVLAWLIGTPLVLIVLLLGFVLWKLPSLSTVSAGIAQMKSAPAQPELKKAVLTSKPVVATTSSDESVKTTNEKAALEEARRTQESINRYMFDRYLDRQDTKPQVCEHLAQAKWGEVKDFNGLGEELGKVASGEEKGNPYVESILAPVAFALRRPPMKELLQDLRASAETPEEADGLLKKAAFYSKVAGVMADLATHKSMLERASQRGYYLYILSRAVSAKPGLASDDSMALLCERIQSQIENEEEGDLSEDKQALEDFLQGVGLDASEVGYDPKMPSEIKLVKNGPNIQMKIPWLDATFSKDHPPTEGTAQTR